MKEKSPNGISNCTRPHLFTAFSQGENCRQKSRTLAEEQQIYRNQTMTWERSCTEAGTKMRLLLRWSLAQLSDLEQLKQSETRFVCTARTQTCAVNQLNKPGLVITTCVFRQTIPVISVEVTQSRKKTLLLLLQNWPCLC